MRRGYQTRSLFFQRPKNDRTHSKNAQAGGFLRTLSQVSDIKKPAIKAGFSFPASPVDTNVGKIRLERVKGIEPSLSAWEAGVMPLYDTRSERLTLYQMWARI